MPPIYPYQIKWHENLKYNGRQRHIGLAFMFISAKNEQVAPFTTCRDYLHDMLFTQINDSTSCYYEEYKPGQMPLISLTQLRLAVVNTDDAGFGDRIEQAQRFIRKIEQTLKIKKSLRVYEMKNHPAGFGGHKVYLFSGDKTWMLSPPMLSLFTLSLRIGFGAIEDEPFEATYEGIVADTLKTYTGFDRPITKTAYHGIKRIKEEGIKKIFYTDPRANYPSAAAGRSDTHSNFGIAAFSAGASKPYMPFWYPRNWVAPTDTNYL